MTTARWIHIPGSHRHALPAARTIGPVADEQPIEVTLYARRNPAGAELRARARKEAARPPLKRKPLTGAEFDTAFGADPADIDTIERWIRGQGLHPIRHHAPGRWIRVRGHAGKFSAAFNTQLVTLEHNELGRFRGRTGDLSVVPEMAGLIEAVFGLDTRPVGRHHRLRTAGHAGHAALRQPAPGIFTPPQLANLYQFPGGDGTGQTIAVLAFNGTDPDPRGGYSAAALATYFSNLNVATPAITDIVVHGPGNAPGPDDTASYHAGDTTGEVMLDLCVVGCLVPGANIRVYFTEFTDRGWVDALSACIADPAAPSVISISYGNPEDDPAERWTQMGVKLVNQTLQAAAAKNITVCCASGDSGAGDQAASGAHVDFPAASPNVLAVGGTTLIANAGAIQSETVWNKEMRGDGATGGGVSRIFSKPDWQSAVRVPSTIDPPHVIGRGVPDVAAVADPETGVIVERIGGDATETTGGTSVAAPLWASLVIRLNEALGVPCGFLNPSLYQPSVAATLNDIVSGDNGGYAAGPGWDACTGLGSPNGTALLAALRKL